MELMKFCVNSGFFGRRRDRFTEYQPERQSPGPRARSARTSASSSIAAEGTPAAADSARTSPSRRSSCARCQASASAVSVSASAARAMASVHSASVPGPRRASSAAPSRSTRLPRRTGTS